MAQLPQQNRLFIGNLAWATTDESLFRAFEDMGSVIQAKVITDRYTGKSRGFGFVTFSTDEEATVAKERMDGVSVDGRSIRVDVALSRN